MLHLKALWLKRAAWSLHIKELILTQGKCGVLRGPSGAGKTSLLETLCGLRAASSGRMELDGEVIGSLPPQRRGLSYVPQDLALFESYTVAEQLAFGLAVRGASVAERNARTTELAKRLRLEKLLARYPAELSGGEAQRVALGRAIAHRPKLLLLDEPFSALDEELREEMCGLVKELQKETGVTVLHITHSRQEAEWMGDVQWKIVEGEVVGV